MAENLNHNVEGSKCYGNDPSNCDKYGRLYDWSTAMALPSSCNSTICSSQVSAQHQGICPSGWHLPSDADRNTLMTEVGGSSKAGKYLKAINGWNNYDYRDIVNLDTYGFSALPGGFGSSGGGFDDVGGSGHWWSASEYNSGSAYQRRIGNESDHASYLSNGKDDYLLSVRCLKN
jgi:uncharacterized protein (TIGR02145 family)